MNIKDIFDKELWFISREQDITHRIPQYAALKHNASLGRIEEAVNERITELELQVKELRVYEAAKNKVLVQLRDRVVELEVALQKLMNAFHSQFGQYSTDYLEAYEVLHKQEEK